ncbi:hypothetical protein CRUP_019633 [Coryphaenoides rupestris]|nr:hypothetical protein CRUP_019633 [Coryphaenoides rupestris]
MRTGEDTAHRYEDLREDTTHYYEDLREDNPQRYEDLREDITHHYEDLREDTTHHYEDPREEDTTHHYEDLREDTTQHYEDPREYTTQHYEDPREYTTHHYEDLREDNPQHYEDLREDTEDLREDTIQHYEDPRQDTTHHYEDLREDTTHHYENLREDTTHHYDDLREDTTNHYEVPHARGLGHQGGHTAAAGHQDDLDGLCVEQVIEQLGGFAGVPPLQQEAGMAAVVQHSALYWHPCRLHHHTTVLQRLTLPPSLISPRCSTESTFPRSDTMVWRLKTDAVSDPARSLPCSISFSMHAASRSLPPQAPPTSASAPTGELRPPQAVVGSRVFRPSAMRPCSATYTISLAAECMDTARSPVFTAASPPRTSSLHSPGSEAPDPAGLSRRPPGLHPPRRDVNPRHLPRYPARSSMTPRFRASSLKLSLVGQVQRGEGHKLGVQFDEAQVRVREISGRMQARSRRCSGCRIQSSQNAAGHLGSSSSQSCRRIIQPRPGKKSVILYDDDGFVSEGPEDLAQCPAVVAGDLVVALELPVVRSHRDVRQFGLPQSWLTIMGCRCAEGRYSSSLSRQRFTVGLLHAMTSTGMTAMSGERREGVARRRPTSPHSERCLWISRRIFFCSSSSASNVLAMRSTPATMSPSSALSGTPPGPGGDGWGPAQQQQNKDSIPSDEEERAHR